MPLHNINNNNNNNDDGCATKKYIILSRCLNVVIMTYNLFKFLMAIILVLHHKFCLKKKSKPHKSRASYSHSKSGFR